MSASAYTQTNLVSDGLIPARVVDPNLINPWGVADSPTGPFWVSDNGTGLTTIYDGAGNPVPVAGHTAITIAAPPGQTHPASPTGQVFNDTRTGFNISSNGHTAPSAFIFATEDGTISGWSPTVDPASSVLAVDNSAAGAIYKGLALGHTGNDSFLFAANFHNGSVDVFDSQFHQVGSFTDATLPAGYAPFNTQVLDGHLFVTFALQDAAKEDDVPGAGHGFVDEFDLQGHLLHRVASGGPLDSPWGLAIRSLRPALGSSPTTFSSGTSATAPSTPSIPATTTSWASFSTTRETRSSSATSGLLSPAMQGRAAIPAVSTSRRACRTKRMDCSET